MPAVLTEREGHLLIVTLNRPERMNAINGEMLVLMLDAFVEADQDPDIRVIILTGAGGNFCSGADLEAIGDEQRRNRIDPHGTGHGPMGPTRMHFTKPVIAAVSGYAVAGGLELALMCDLRVVEASSVFGVFCRRWGVPLIDGGTVRLPRIVGHGRAMDMILTGRPVNAEEALEMGLANRLVPDGTALQAAQELAATIAGFPQRCMRADRASAIHQWDLDTREALEAAVADA